MLFSEGFELFIAQLPSIVAGDRSQFTLSLFLSLFLIYVGLGTYSWEEQDHDQATFAPKLDKRDGFVTSLLFSHFLSSSSCRLLDPASSSALQLHRTLLALTPFVSSWLFLASSSGQQWRAKILDASVEEESDSGSESSDASRSVRLVTVEGKDNNKDNNSKKNKKRKALAVRCQDDSQLLIHRLQLPTRQPMDAQAFYQMASKQGADLLTWESPPDA